jgi:rubredoxin
MPELRRPGTGGVWRRPTAPGPWGQALNTADPYYTSTYCPRCETRIEGLRNRYACRVCGWVSPPDHKPPATQQSEE